MSYSSFLVHICFQDVHVSGAVKNFLNKLITELVMSCLDRRVSGKTQSSRNLSGFISLSRFPKAK